MNFIYQHPCRALVVFTNFTTWHDRQGSDKHFAHCTERCHLFNSKNHKSGISMYIKFGEIFKWLDLKGTWKNISHVMDLWRSPNFQDIAGVVLVRQWYWQSRDHKYMYLFNPSFQFYPNICIYTKSLRCPIHKKRNFSICANYLGISLLNIRFYRSG